MPTEKETREAIAEVITLTVASTVTVIPRDVLGLFRQGDYKPLLAAGATYTRGWMVTQKAATWDESESGDTYAAYRPAWHVWQLHEYFTGDDVANSEDVASAEREAVMAAFANPSAVVGIQQATLDALATLGRITFPTIACAPMTEGGKLYHWAQGEIAGRYNTAGC